MQIVFANRKIERLCSSAKEMKAKLGIRMAEKLQQRLQELMAAENLEDMRHLPGAGCHELTGNLKGKLALYLVHPQRLILSPYHDPIPICTGGGLDWSSVTAIRVEEITDYH